MKLYNVEGKQVSEILMKNYQLVKYKINFDGATYPSGVYFYRLSVICNFIANLKHPARNERQNIKCATTGRNEI